MKAASPVRATLALLALSALVPAVRAEVSVNANGQEIYVQADPGQIWTRHRSGVPSSHLLNPFGDARGDGAPAIAKNPATGAWEAAWGRAGVDPGLVFAHFDLETHQWFVRDVTRSAAVDSWAGRVVQLVHDDFGNRFIGFWDPRTGAVLLSSAPRDSHDINRPIVVSQAGVRGSAPALYWDGAVLVIAYSRPGGGLDVVHLVPDVDENGRIPNAGIGIPGIPDLQVSVEPGTSGPHPLSVGAGSGVAPIPWPGGGGSGGSSTPPVADDAQPPLVRIEPVWGDRLLVTWIESPTELGYLARIGGEWSFAGMVAMEDPVEHEAARAEALRELTGSTPGRGRSGR